MKNLILLLFLLLTVNCFSKNGSRASIKFIDENPNGSKTYLGKMKKGDLYSLNDYLKRSKESDLSVGKDQEKTNSASYDDYIKYATKAKKKDTRRKKKESNKYISSRYKINERRLLKRNKKYHQKYLDAKEEAITKAKKEPSKKKDVDKTLSFSEYSALKGDQPKKAYLSRYYKIKGKRLRNGKKLSYPEGNISLLIKYEIKSGRLKKTYVSIVQAYVKAGSSYYLKYHGNDSKRSYYLERYYE